MTAELAETITERRVADGAQVSAGDTVMVQNTARIDAAIREATARVSELQARLDELLRGPRREQIEAARASLAGAREELAFREKELARAEDIFRRDVGSEESVDRAAAAVDAARAAVGVDEARLEELLTGTTAEELRQAEARLAQAQAAVERLEIDRARHRIEAPLAGVIDTLLFETGERPQPGQVLAILLVGDQPYARIYVPEELRVQVTAGTKATVYIDGRDTPIPGRVRWVSSEAAFTPYFALTEHDRGRLTFLAEIDLHYDGERLPDGVPVQVELELPDEGDAP